MMNRCTPLSIAFIVILAAVAFVANAQQADTALYLLNSATVNGKHTVGTSSTERFATGGTLITSDSATMSQLAKASLTDYMNFYSPAYVRGGSSRATVSLRGTGSSHTSVTWNGVSITPVTLGQADLNRIPMFFLDQVSVHAGGESALYGNGSIGGSIQLTTQAIWNAGVQAELLQTGGSFGTTFSGLKLGVGGKTWLSKTGVLYSRSSNNFPFTNIATSAQDVQHNAAYHSAGVQQELYFKLSPRSTLSSQTRLMSFFNELQPAMSMNSDTARYTSIDDRLLHSLLTFANTSNFMRLSVTGGYLYDKEEYHTPEKINISKLIATHRAVGMAEAEKLLFNRLRIKLGVSSDYIVPHTDAYKSGVSEWRCDVYALMLMNMGHRWEANMNLRQTFVTDLSVPFTPSAGLAYKLASGATHELKLRASASRSVKVPTLNDRYWGSIAGRDLRPEYSTGFDGGADFRLNGERFSFSASAVAYRNVVDDWIIWLQSGSQVSPYNMEQVNATGAEAVVNARWLIGQLTVQAGATYAYTNSKVEKGLDENDNSRGRQLIYQPYHRATGLLNLDFKGWTLGVNLSYVGERYGSDINDAKSAYLLTNLTAEKSLTFGKHSIVLNGRVDNLADVSYQSMSLFAMPGRSYNAGIRYLFKSK